MRKTPLLMLLVIAGISPAIAQRGGWVDKLQNQSGAVCCYDNDGRRLDDPDWRITGDHYEVLFPGEGWITVPEWAAVNGRNQDGIARVWSDKGEGARTVRCFLPGVEG